MKKNLIVQKYGGATLSDPQKIKQVASRIAEASKQGQHLVAVVSAMGKTTNQLIELANQISEHPNRRELDMLLTTGERISMALVTMALHDLDCPAISFTGSQAGIMTDDSHVNAFILDVKAHRIDEALQKHKVVVLAGFQGVSPTTKEITTLGRGGSDTTAVAMAAYLKADRCEILKDVECVFSADPKIVPNAKPLRELSYDHLCDMTFWGAKMLHYRSAELAKRMHVPLYIGPAADTTKAGTMIQEKVNFMYEATKILALNSHEKVLNVEVSATSSSLAWTLLQDFLNENEIAFPQVLLSEKNSQSVRFFLTGPSEILSAIEKENHKGITVHNEVLSSITATCTGATADGINMKIFNSLKAAQVEVLGSLHSPLSTTVLVKTGERQRALQELHRLIES